MTAAELNDCFLHDKDRMRHAEAIAALVSRVPVRVATEKVDVTAANGRIAAETLRAPAAVPGHRNAAVDGYSFATSDYDPQHSKSLLVSGRAAAGHPFAQPLGADEAVRILTGAPVPEAHDSIVMQEDVSLNEDGRVILPAGLKPGANVRAAGEDLLADDVIVSAGHTLRPQDLAALSSAGFDAVLCYRAPRIGVFSSGDEVVRTGAPLAYGQVYDANTALLQALLASIGADFEDLGVLPDDRDVVRTRVAEAATRFDVVMTSGGASLGEEDHFVAVLDEIGTRHLWQIAVKPGRPMMFGQVEDAVFMGLPGNPVAVFVCFLLYGRPLVHRIGGGIWREPQRFMVPAGFAIARKKPDRREFLRGTINDGSDGPIVTKYPKDGSGLISSLRNANGLIEIPEEITSVAEGDLVRFIPFSEFGIL